MVDRDQRSQPGPVHPYSQLAAERPASRQRPRPLTSAVTPHQLRHRGIQQDAGDRDHFGENERVAYHRPPPSQTRSGTRPGTGSGTGDLAQPGRPDLLLLPVQGLLPPPAHHCRRQPEHLSGVCSRSACASHHTVPPPLRGDDLRAPADVEVLQRLVGVRVQCPSTVAPADPLPACRVPHHPHRLAGTGGSAGAAPERHGARCRAAGAPLSLRPVRRPDARSQLAVLVPPPWQRACQHLFADSA